MQATHNELGYLDAEVSAAMADSTGLALQKEVRSTSIRFALFFADGVVGAVQCLIRCARTVTWCC